MEALIKTLEDSKTGNKVLPRTKSRAITMEDGMILDDKLVELDQQLISLSAALDERTAETCIVNISVQNGVSLAGQKITLSNITNSSKSETYTVQSGESRHTFKVASGQDYKISVDAKLPYVTPAESSQFTAIAGNSRTVTMQYISTATFNVYITGNNKSSVTVTATKGAKVVSGVTNLSGVCSFTTDELGTYNITYGKSMLSATQSINVSSYTTYSITGQTDDKVYIYNNGIINTSLTGGLEKFYGSTVTFGSSTITLTSTSGDVTILGSVNKIDVTAYSKLKVELLSNNGTFEFGLASAKGLDFYNNGVAKNYIVDTVVSARIYETNISSITGTYYYGMRTGGTNTAVVSKIWLE